jgi:2-keto-4-pentenoate hydratase/2-oxohepta-3-ene-1,7-dioic acid hydratase in catechol pathway
MRLITFERQNKVEPGVLLDNEAVGLRDAGFPDVLSVIAGGPDALERVRRWIQSPPAGAVAKRADIRLRAPILRPPKIICVGLNYRDHAVESNLAIPEVPTVFCKFHTAILGPDEPVILPKASSKPDYEAEFAFVIGKGGRHIAKDSWQEHIFGYMNLNDVSARDFQMATTQWMMGKTFDTFAPTGPWLTTADEIPDPHALDISLTLSGEVMQHSNTHELIFRIPDLISYLSSVFTLEPGDIVSTGTPSGVGFARKPPRFLRAGDEMVVRVAGLGELRNPVVAES